MKLNDSKIRKKVATYLQSDDFRKEFNKAHPITQASIVPYPWTLSDIEREINELKGMLLEAAQDLAQRREGTPTLSGGREGGSRFDGIISPSGLLSHRITNIVKDPSNPRFIISCKVELFFNPDWVRSPSLNPKNKGVDNLLRLLTNGWDFRGNQMKAPKSEGAYRGLPYGTWYSGSSVRGRGTPIPGVWAQTYREPRYYLFDAVRRYNQKKAEDKIYAYLDSSYVNVSGVKESTLIKRIKQFGGTTMPIYDVRIRGIGGIAFGRR